ncbi:MAG TPA: DUF1990 domain-containing protein [Pyrinomonadaceae bacterium]|nr:DUF1990 domain-containing protein [Pyrinomonadaceae bacterium]
MFLLRPPSAERVRDFIEQQRSLAFTYAQVGATLTKPPLGYRVDHNRIQLGTGKETYLCAIEALKRWKQFDLGWVRIANSEVVLQQDAVVAVEVKACGLWSLNAARVVYLVDDSRDTNARFGFAYGTLPGHAEEGEERFIVEWLADDSVWYDIFAFSRPRHPLARLTRPIVRSLQKRFAKDSLAAMKRAVGYY